MKFRILAVAIVLLFYAAEESSAEETLSGEDQTIWESFKGIPDPDPKTNTKDCNAAETLKSLAWLKQMTSQKDIKGNEKKENVLAKRWTDLSKLRKFLKTQNYTDEPGSIQFFNWQDKHINLDCGKITSEWSVIVPNSQYNDYAKKFASENKGQKISPSASIPQVYFRIFKCKAKGIDCTHMIYAFNRPLPIVEFPIYHVEGEENIHFDCKIHSCIAENVKNEECRFPLKPEPVKQNEPFKFFWTLPETEKMALDHLHTERKLRRNKTLPLGIKMKDMKHNKSGNIYGSRLVIDLVELKHEGVYECVIQDANGVVSTVDNEKVFDSSVHYRGVGKFHVRAKIWLYIAIGITATLLVLTFLMNYCLPSNAEFDDQALEKKDK